MDEFRTSCSCFKCHERCEKFLTSPDPRPYKDGSLRLVHGLLRCKNVNCSCLWNRDRNGASNICEIFFNEVYGLGRPEYLCRNTSDN